MSFFDRHRPEPLPPEPQERTPPREPWERPELELPASVPLDFELARSADAVVAVFGVRAYRTGFAFTLLAVLREEDRTGRLFQGHFRRLRTMDGTPPELLRLGLEFADGTVVTNLAGRMPGGPGDTPDGPILQHSSGSGGGRVLETTYWVWPLPPAGPIAFIGEWPAVSVPETRVSVDAQLILDASRRSLVLWPE